MLNLHDLVGRDDAFLDLLDCPTTFPKVFGLLGWNIQLFHTQLIRDAARAGERRSLSPTAGTRTTTG